MPAQVRNLGDLKNVRTADGRTVERKAYLKFHDEHLPCLNTDNHFLYRTNRLGSSILCTCGGQGVSVGWHEYKNFTSQFLGNEVLMCYYYVKDKVHADGST
jgi:hypothetical protein